MSDYKEIYIKLGAARTRLILDQPFIGALALHFSLKAADARWCRTAATDARAFYFNPAYVAELSLAQTQFLLAHEALHCALGHFARRQHRVRRRWDVACDHAVNLLLADEGLKAPPRALLNRAYRGLSAEEIYPLIPPDTVETTLDRHLFEERAPLQDAAVAHSGSENPAPGVAPEQGAIGDGWDDAGNELRRHAGAAARPREPGAVEREDLARRWQGRMASAAQQARQAGRLSRSWERLIDDLIQPQLPWRHLLARYLMGVTREDYSYRRPSRREGDALLPRLAGGEVDLYIALDTSGSIQDEELAQFASEVDALKGQVRARVTLHACDERLDERGPWTFQPWEPVALPREAGGGGGTCFAPVFDWIAAERRRPDLLLYFTDADGEFPRYPPDYPVIWLVKGKSRVPWGERIQLN